jgi:hypothetical protein
LEGFKSDIRGTSRRLDICQACNTLVESEINVVYSYSTLGWKQRHADVEVAESHFDATGRVCSTRRISSSRPEFVDARRTCIVAREASV